MPSLPSLILLLTGVGFTGFGTAYALRPTAMAGLTDLTLPTATARADFMATYGGFQVGFGIFLIASARAEDWLRPGLCAAIAALAGFASVRSLGIWFGRGIRGTIWIGLVIEIAALVANAWALRHLS